MTKPHQVNPLIKYNLVAALVLVSTRNVSSKSGMDGKLQRKRSSGRSRFKSLKNEIFF